MTDLGPQRVNPLVAHRVGNAIFTQTNKRQGWANQVCWLLANPYYWLPNLAKLMEKLIVHCKQPHFS